MTACACGGCLRSACLCVKNTWNITVIQGQEFNIKNTCKNVNLCLSALLMKWYQSLSWDTTWLFECAIPSWVLIHHSIRQKQSHHPLTRHNMVSHVYTQIPVDCIPPLNRKESTMRAMDCKLGRHAGVVKGSRNLTILVMDQNVVPISLRVTLLVYQLAELIGDRKSVV